MIYHNTPSSITPIFFPRNGSWTTLHEPEIENMTINYPQSEEGVGDGDEARDAIMQTMIMQVIMFTNVLQ